MVKNLSVFISAGDISGDIHAGKLAEEIKKLDNGTIYSIGGDCLRKISDIFIDDIVNINAFGFFPIKQFFFLKKVFKKVQKCLIENKINKVVLVDYYGFNIHVAKLAHGLNIPVYYYVTPQIWASRKFRIKKIAKYVKLVFPILPFEKDIYTEYGIPAVFEGNPLIDIVPSCNNKNIKSKQEINIGLFAGSRKNTIERHLPIIVDTVKLLNKQLKAKFYLFSLGEIDYNLPEYITVKSGNNYNERSKIDIALCPSGTVSLENALMGIPMVVMYKLSWLNYLLARLIVKVKYITLVNILGNKEIVPEYIQQNATPEKLSKAIINLLDVDIYNTTKEELLKFKNCFGKNGVAKRVAQKIIGD